ncbi:MAG: hypothetical protein Fur0025_13520 [Oscillatoriaceae cyanobacterium]
MMLTYPNNANQTRWILAGLFAITIALEFTTPQPYVFGYLYTVPILLANTRISRAETIGVTVAGIVLTLLNIFWPNEYPVSFSNVANRLIAVMALVITSWLSDRNRQYQAELAQQQAKLEAQAQLASLREDFVFTLTHDLKTPLLGAIETINSFRQEKFGSVTPTQKKVLATMGRSHQNSLELVETLLDIYRNDAEGLQLQKQEVNLTDLATDAVATFTELAQSRRLHIKLTYGASDFRRHFWVEGDPLQLQRVFANFLANAINYSPEVVKWKLSWTPNQTTIWLKSLTADGEFPQKKLLTCLSGFTRVVAIGNSKAPDWDYISVAKLLPLTGGQFGQKTIPAVALFLASNYQAASPIIPTTYDPSFPADFACRR